MTRILTITAQIAIHFEMKDLMKSVSIFNIIIFVCANSYGQDSIFFAHHIESYNVVRASAEADSFKSENNRIFAPIVNVTDIDGNLYDIVKIGTQYWMGENLKTTRFNDGTRIPLVSAYDNWKILLSPGFCWYFNDKAKYGNDYGALYNGYAVNTGKLCPAGWHVPGKEDWDILILYLGGGKLAGGKLKGNSHWFNPNQGATNETGFNAFPGGNRGKLGSFLDEGLRGHWWSSTKNDEFNLWDNNLSYSLIDVNLSYDDVKSGLSVRCIKD